MTLDITKQKDKAIELMKQMDIYKPYIQGFRENGMVCFFERLAAIGLIRNLNSMLK